MRKITFLALLAAMLCLPQCMMAKTDPVFGLQDVNGVLSSICVGHTYNASPVLYNHQNLPVTWSSSNEEYFTVDQNGIITPLKSYDLGDLYLRVHTDGDENYNAADGQLQISISDALVILPYTSAAVAVTPTNASNILGNGKLSYDYATRTLTMNNWVVDCPTDFSISISDIYWMFKYADNGPLTINLVGTNSITDGKDLFDIQDLTFTGSGSLTVNGETRLNAYGTLTIDGVNLTLNRATDDLSPYQGYADMAFGVNELSVVNGGNFHVTVSTNVDLSSCGSCYTVGWVGTLTAGDILTEHVIWSADAANEADINYAYKNANYDGYFFDDQGGAMLPRELEIGIAAPAPDPRKVPDLKFNWNYITEATIIKDVHGWVYEPGTDAIPQTSYSVYVYEDFYEPGVYTTKQPSELDLEMTYSVTTSAPSDPNKDVITLTNTTGDYFEFDYQAENINYGDVVITASTEGNEEYQPASATFTIHVINGKGAERECVLKYVAGPYAGQLVPAADEFDNLQTGDEVHMEWMRLVEKNYPDVVYAPSHSIWGSEKYYIACRESELKLRALTAGDDKFTVKYARYEDGDANGNFQVIEIPVHIKPSQPALVSSLDLSSATLQDQNVVFNAVYDQAAHEAQLAGTLTTQQVLDVMNSTNYNSQVWRDNLPQTISFELAGGKGSFEVNCNVQPGYEVRIIQYGDTKANHIITSSTPQPYVVNYDIPNQRAVVIFVAVAGSSNPAPKRAPASKNDAPIATLSALNMNPTYPIEAKVDPDNAGVYYSTHFNGIQKYLLPAGTEAYAATISNTGDLNMTKVADGGQVIPANTALILKSNAASVVLTPTDADAVTVNAANDLQGVDVQKTAPANCYVLSGHSTDYLTNGVGFYAFSGTLAAHKAYVIYNGAGAPQRMRFVFNNEQTATGIDNANDVIKSEKRIENGQLIIIKNGVRYNAQGQIVK